MRVLCLVALAAFWPTMPCAGTTGAADLKFIRDGTTVRTLDLAALQAGCQVQKITIDDPNYGRRMSYLACPLAEVLRLGFGVPPQSLAADSFLLRARDGYAKPVTGARLLEPGGFLAFADANRTPGAGGGWEPIERKQADPGPYYLVWALPAGTDPSQYPWPYQLAAIEIASLETLYPHIIPRGLPPTSPAVAGYKIFRTQCIACHAINGEGGTIGPDLNIPMSIVEYRPATQIKAYIRNPASFRYSNMPPQPHLSDQQLEELFAYFGAMRMLKFDPKGEAGAAPTP